MKCLPDLSLTGWRQGATGISGPQPDPDPPLLPDLAYDALHVIYDPAKLFADTAGSTPADVDQAVARVEDASGNDNHAIQATVAARPIRRESGGLNWLDFDGVDDRLITPSDASWVKDGMSLVSVFRVPVSTGRLVLLGNAGTSGTAVAGYMQNGETFPTSQGFSDSNAADYYTNGAFIGTNINRTQAYAAWVTGDWVVTEIANINFVGSEFAAQGVQFPGWRSRAQELGPVDFGAQILIPTAILDTGTNRADLVAALAEQFGITL